MIAFETDNDAIEFINQYGPEHYIICMENEEAYVNAIQNAVSFVGTIRPKAQETMPLALTILCLLTDLQKQYSGVNLDSF